MMNFRAVTIREPGKDGTYIHKDDVVLYFLHLAELKDPIEKVLVVSTAHITDSDCEYFYLIQLTENILESIGEVFSPAFKKLIEFAKNHEEGFTHLKLDRDGNELEGFEQFDW
jgi:hypothetical protein